MIVEIKPADYLVAGCTGKSGQRTFYIQAAKEGEILTILCEKFQVQQLAEGIRQFIDLETDVLSDTEPELQLRQPVEPMFRLGEIDIGYDQDSELMILIAQEIGKEGSENEDDSAAVTARIWATPLQMLQMANHGEEQASRGRPICGNCMQPIDSEGHFCPKSNGHK